MASGGDYSRMRRIYSAKTYDGTILAATDDQTDLLTPKSADHQLYIQKIAITITTYSAKTWTFQDDASTPVEIYHISIPAAATALPSESSTMVADFGPEGTPLTKGKNLDLAMSAAGAAGRIHIEGYERLVGPVAAATTN